MLKYLLVVAVIGFVYFFFIKKKPLKKPSFKATSKDSELKSNDMVECPTCGVYSEIDDSILSNGKYYCSAECAKES